MTRPSQKKQERLYAEEAARRLDKTWDLGSDDERPDFVVMEGGRRFGLEVTEIFQGRQSRGGSTLKKKEASAQRSVNNLRRQYEAIADTPLTVKFVGSMEADNLATVVPALIAEDFSSKPIGYHFVHDTTNLHPDRARLRVHVTKALRPWWLSVSDRVGFVDRSPQKAIAAAIEKKAEGLDQCKAKVGDDVRLLIVADRNYNSGKLSLEEPAEFDFRGFKAVYFFSYPTDVVVLDQVS